MPGACVRVWHWEVGDQRGESYHRHRDKLYSQSLKLKQEHRLYRRREQMQVVSPCECCDFVTREDKVLVFTEEITWLGKYSSSFTSHRSENHVAESHWDRRRVLFSKLIWSKLLAWKTGENCLGTGHIGRLGAESVWISRVTLSRALRVILIFIPTAHPAHFYRGF